MKCPQCGGELDAGVTELYNEAPEFGKGCVLWFPMIKVPVCNACQVIILDDNTKAVMKTAAESLVTSPMTQYVIFDHPNDYPNNWVIGIKTIGKGVVLNDPGNLIMAESLEDARSKVPPGKVCIPNSPTDPPKVVESWI